MNLVKDIKTQTVRVYNERVLLNENDIKNTCLSFAVNAQKCIDEAVSGEVFINNIESYVQDKQQDIINYKNGNFTPWLGFWQTAVYLKTGESVPMLS